MKRSAITHLLAAVMPTAVLGAAAANTMVGTTGPAVDSDNAALIQQIETRFQRH